MARGDIKWFAQGLHDLGEKIHDMSSDAWRLGIVTSTTTPTVNTTAPHWGGTGTTNFASNQVSTGTGYAGPITLTVNSWTLTSAGADWRLTDVTINQDAGGGFTNGAWGILYNNSDANKRAVGYIDLDGPIGNVSGPITIEWNGANNDVLRLAQS